MESQKNNRIASRTELMLLVFAILLGAISVVWVSYRVQRTENIALSTQRELREDISYNRGRTDALMEVANSNRQLVVAIAQALDIPIVSPDTLR